jgi:hypothetical protein
MAIYSDREKEREGIRQREFILAKFNFRSGFVEWYMRGTRQRSLLAECFFSALGKQALC